MLDTKKSFFQKLKNKYRLVILNDQTFEEKLSFKLSRLNVFIAVGSLCILLVFFTTYIIAFTPLKEYIPGYADFSTRKEIHFLSIKADSLEKAVKQKDIYIKNIKNVLEGGDELNEIPELTPIETQNKEIKYSRSKADSLLRKEIESQAIYNLKQSSTSEPKYFFSNQSIRNFSFFTPLNGIVSSNFDPSKQHFGIDIVAPRNEAVKATLDGTVIMSAWTLETGYTIAIQHQNNLISVYKHNSALIKKEGEFVKAGEVIAIIGETGVFATGIHLHFELWFNGIAVNPREYINF